MWRGVVRLACIIMGGVLVVMTLGIGVRRNETLPRVLILRRIYFVGQQNMNEWVGYAPEINHSWQLGKQFRLYQRRYVIEAKGQTIAFPGMDNFLYRASVLSTDRPQRLSPHPITSPSPFPIKASPNREWIIFSSPSSSPDYSDLYAIRISDSYEVCLSCLLPNDSLHHYEEERLIFSPDSQFIALDAYSYTLHEFVTYVMRLDGTEVRLVWSKANDYAYVVSWMDEGLIIQAQRIPYWVNTSDNTTHPIVLQAKARVNFVRWLPQDHLFVVREGTRNMGRLVAIREDGRIEWQSSEFGSIQWFGLANTLFVQRESLQLVDPTTGKFVKLKPEVSPHIDYRTSTSPERQWMVFNAVDQATQQEALWRFDLGSTQLTRLWGPTGVDIFDLWVSPDGQEILVDAATPTWAGLLRMNPDGSDVRELTSVQDIELGEHDFVDWATLPDRAWQPIALAGGGLLLTVVGIGWPVLRKILPRRRQLA